MNTAIKQQLEKYPRATGRWHQPRRRLEGLFH